MASHPKLEQKIRDTIVQPAQAQMYHGNYGMIVRYDELRNEADIYLTSPGADEFHELLRKVPCPLTPGIQTVAPQVGRICWVSFPDGGPGKPIVTHFFNSFYGEGEYNRQTAATVNMPRFLLNL